MLHTFFMLIVISEYIVRAMSFCSMSKFVMHKTCSPVMCQLRVRTAGASLFMYHIEIELTVIKRRIGGG